MFDNKTGFFRIKKENKKYTQLYVIFPYISVDEKTIDKIINKYTIKFYNDKRAYDVIINKFNFLKNEYLKKDVNSFFPKNEVGQFVYYSINEFLKLIQKCKYLNDEIKKELILYYKLY